MKIARIVSSNSHIAYIARVLEERDGEGVPSADDFGFGRFVSLGFDDGMIVGVICDSRLVNPEYAAHNPRMASMPALGDLKRDLVDEKKALVGILLLGTLDGSGVALHEIPRRIVPAGQLVETLPAEQIRAFHHCRDLVQIRYFPNLMANAGSLAVPLAKAMIEQITPHCSEADRQRLAVITNALLWKQTFDDLRV